MGLGLFLRAELDPGKETFVPITPYLGPEVTTDRLPTIDMENAPGGFPGRKTADGGLKNSFAHFVNHVWDPSRVNCKIQYCTDYTKNGERAQPTDPSERCKILVLGATRLIPPNGEALGIYGSGYRLDQLGELDLPTLTEALEFGNYTE